jgi:parvulin-like peptidyl-prolyl isomerase
MCCRYTSFDDFLQKNYYTLSEFRREIAVDFGMTKYMESEWDKKHLQGAEQKAMVEKERGRLEKEYVKMTHIFFNTAQKPEYANAPEKVIGEANRKAKDAWMRLRMGTNFEQLAAEISEDTMSKSKGGNVGCVSVYAFGNVLKEVKGTQKVGEYGKPVESPFGVHIIKLLPMTDEDAVELLKQEYVEKEGLTLSEKIQAEAKIVRMEKNKPTLKTNTKK